MNAQPPVILITSQAQAALEAEVERTGLAADVVGGLLFGRPIDETRRLIVGSVRPSPEVMFGTKEFCLDQSRTSRQLDEARQQDPEAHYCGVWYIHRTPEAELNDEEWVQAQGVLEDPDYRFQDLICLVLCFYFGELKTHAFHFTRYHSARGQLPEPASIEIVSGDQTPATSHRASFDEARGTNWYQVRQVAERLNQEYQQLKTKYHIEAARSADGQMIFRLVPHNHPRVAFYLACRSGFPATPPEAFLLAGGVRHPLISAALADWEPERHLVEIADDVMKWLILSLDQYVERAEEAMKQEQYRQAEDLLTVVLSIDPRTPRAARLLARVQAPLRMVTKSAGGSQL